MKGLFAGNTKRTNINCWTSVLGDDLQDTRVATIGLLFNIPGAYKDMLDGQQKFAKCQECILHLHCMDNLFDYIISDLLICFWVVIFICLWCMVHVPYSLSVLFIFLNPSLSYAVF